MTSNRNVGCNANEMNEMFEKNNGLVDGPANSRKLGFSNPSSPCGQKEWCAFSSDVISDVSMSTVFCFKNRREETSAMKHQRKPGDRMCVKFCFMSSHALVVSGRFSEL